MEHTYCWKTSISFLAVLLLGVAGCQPSTPASAAKAKVQTVAASPAAPPAASPATKALQDFTLTYGTADAADLSQPKPADPPAKSAAKPAPKSSEELPEEERPRDLGPPLVDQISDLRKLDPVSPVWIDMKHHQVVFQGEVCQANYPLEFLVTYPERGYESVMVVKVKPSVVHAGLVALGAEPGTPCGLSPSTSRPAGRRSRSGSAGRTRPADGRRLRPGIGSARSRPRRPWRSTGFRRQRSVEERVHRQARVPGGPERRFHSRTEPALGHARPAAKERRGHREPQLRGLQRAASTGRNAGDPAVEAETRQAEMKRMSRPPQQNWVPPQMLLNCASQAAARTLRLRYGMEARRRR